ncbi:DUF2489 domain-containing protein [Aliiglaciecola sp. LCG003]|uniref:DUF2489 domain-containing protein n=1 Tax=Aliiglaciecola sp. LCG003 TaxID=3053655 RepID=UPI0025743265|nr:DUF2489 domain-containing protein [Aliiglaciecola sp. LCG003]WJG09467.1 DUF2489 domain-containing protein [Aliiglaciecola sp. LCG003]
MSGVEYLVVGLCLVFLAGLAFYAGKLLFQLKQQKQRQLEARRARVLRIMESIQTIALAVEQQQCNLSEGAIRLVNLLDCIPVESPPNCERDYPQLFELFTHVRHLPTHQQRKFQNNQERKEQDKIREEQEAQLEAGILKEVALIRQLEFKI